MSPWRGRGTPPPSHLESWSSEERRPKDPFINRIPTPASAGHPEQPGRPTSRSRSADVVPLTPPAAGGTKPEFRFCSMAAVDRRRRNLLRRLPSVGWQNPQEDGLAIASPGLGDADLFTEEAAAAWACCTPTCAPSEKERENLFNRCPYKLTSRAPHEMPESVEPGRI